jgi:hypothetical protein
MGQDGRRNCAAATPDGRSVASSLSFLVLCLFVSLFLIHLPISISLQPLILAPFLVVDGLDTALVFSFWLLPG